MQNPHGGGLFILLSCMKSKLNLASNHRQTQKTKAAYHFVPKIHGNQSQAVWSWAARRFYNQSGEDSDHDYERRAALQSSKHTTKSDSGRSNTIGNATNSHHRGGPLVGYSQFYNQSGEESDHDYEQRAAWLRLHCRQMWKHHPLFSPRDILKGATPKQYSTIRLVMQRTYHRER